MKVYSASSKDYELREEVGHGASATVYRAIYLPLNEVVAVKCLDLDRCNSNLDDIRKEAQTMSLIDHPNVISAYCSFVVEHHLWVVMPFMAEGSCLHLMKISFPDGFEEPVICSVLKETLKALEYLHRHGHIHRDVKAGNILLDSTGIVKLGDFGVSACMFDKGDRQRSRNTFVGTPCWMAPEVLQPGSGYDFKADIWSFGITALEMAHGHAPFSKYPPMKVLLMTIQNAPPGLDYDRDRKFSKSFKEMVAMCLVKDPTKRPTAEKLLKHSFFKNVKPPELSVKKILVNLPPLWDRVKALQLQDAAQLALRKLPSAEEEALSLSQYQRGVSAWKFDIEDLKKQAALIQDDEDLPGPREGNGNSKSNITEKDSLALRSASEMTVTEDESDIRYVANGAVTLENRASSGKDYVIEADASDSMIQGRLDSFELERLKNDAIPVGKKEAENSQSKSDPVRKPQTRSGQLLPGNVFASLSSEKGQTSDSQLPPEKSKRDVRKVPNFSGPLMLPNRASANSLSAPTAPTRSSGGYRDEDKHKGNVVQIKGRFSVTSENVDLAQEISISTPARMAAQGSPLRKSASVGDWQLDSKQPPINLCKEIANNPVPASVLVPHLQNLLHQTSFQQNLITNLLNSLQQPEQTYGAALMVSSSEDKIPADAVPSEREQLFLIKISELQTRMASLTDELTVAKVKQAQLQEQLKAACCPQEEKKRREEQEG